MAIALPEGVFVKERNRENSIFSLYASDSDDTDPSCISLFSKKIIAIGLNNAATQLQDIETKKIVRTLKSFLQTAVSTLAYKRASVFVGHESGVIRHYDVRSEKEINSKIRSIRNAPLLIVPAKHTHQLAVAGPDSPLYI